MSANAITTYLVMFLSKEIPGLDVWRNNRIDAAAVGRGGRVRRVQAGVDGQADLTGHIAPTGRRIEIEVKGPGDRQNKNQQDFQRRCERHGTLYIICRIARKETVEQIRWRMEQRDYSSHPAEMQAFFYELRRRLNERHDAV